MLLLVVGEGLPMVFDFALDSEREELLYFSNIYNTSSESENSITETDGSILT